MFYNKHTEAIIGEWNMKANNCGGCSQKPTFFRNPQYLIQTKKSTQALFELDSPDQFPVGMVLFEIPCQDEAKQISKMDYCELVSNPRTNPTFLTEVNTLRTNLRLNKSYILVPSTY
jgi:hypothetical protein